MDLLPSFVDETFLALGRFDVFAHFKVTYDELGQRVGLEPYPLYKRGQHPYPFPGAVLGRTDRTGWSVRDVSAAAARKPLLRFWYDAARAFAA